MTKVFKCGFYEAETTPFLGGTIPGYNRTRIAEGVKSKLYAKAVAFENDGKQMVIITLDTISTPQHICDGIYERVEKFIGLSKEQIMITALHNHTSGTYYECTEFHQYDELATELVIRRASDCAVLALQRLEEAEVFYGCEKAEDIAFIRNYLMKDGSIRTNPGNLNPDIVKPIGEPDEDFPFLIFKNNEGKYIGALSSFALHQDTIAGNDYCGEYSGVLSDKLKEAYGPAFVSVFMNGFCGNINHCVTHIDNKLREKPVYVRSGRVLFETMQKCMDNLEKIDNPKIGSVRKTLTVEQRKVDPELLERSKEIMTRDTEWDFENLNINDPESDVFIRAKAPELIEYAKTQDEPCHPEIQVMNIGDILVFAANGECYVEFQHYIKENSPTDKNLFASNSNAAFTGYMPVKEMYGIKTLYEANLPSAKMVPGSGEKISEELVNMANELVNRN